jgi:hypothetical protein
MRLQQIRTLFFLFILASPLGRGSAEPASAGLQELMVRQRDGDEDGRLHAGLLPARVHQLVMQR